MSLSCTIERISLDYLIVFIETSRCLDCAFSRFASVAMIGEHLLLEK